MEYKINKLPRSEAEIRVVLSKEEFEPYIKKAAVQLSQEITIEGFRKGKAPFEVVRKQVGDAALLEHGAEGAVRAVYPEVLTRISRETENFTPIGRPEVTVTKLAPGNEFTFKITLALLPEVLLPDYKKIAREAREKKMPVSVSDDDISRALLWLQESRTELSSVDRPAKEGDAVEVDFTVCHGGVTIEGGDSKNHPLIIGKGKFIPGFENQLIGMSAGEKKTFELAAPADWHQKNLAGKALEFSVDMKRVQERKIPELNDEFFKRLGAFASLDALRKNIREGLAQEKEEKETQRIRGVILDEIVKKTKAEVPKVLCSSELEKMLAELQNGVKSMGMHWSEYLKHIKKTPEELRQEWESEAEKRVRSALVLREIARIEHIGPTEEEIKTRTNEFLVQFNTVQDAEKHINPEELREYTRGVIRNEKVFEFLESV